MQFDIIKQSPPENFDDYGDITQFYVYYVENTKIRLGCKYLLKDGIMLKLVMDMTTVGHMILRMSLKNTSSAY